MLRAIKIFIAKQISQPFVGCAIKRIHPQINFYGTKINLANPYLKPQTIAQIYWQMYESAEARLIRKYLKSDLPVIELGASMGIISTLISKHCNQKLICVEPNPRIIPSIKYNLNHAGHTNYTIIQAGIAYGRSKVKFSEPDTHLGGSVGETGIEIDAITLQKILAEYAIKRYQLVVDIEGSEIELLLFDKEALKQADLIIIELHQTKHEQMTYSVADIKRLFLESGFALLQKDGNVFAFRNISS